MFKGSDTLRDLFWVMYQYPDGKVKYFMRKISSRTMLTANGDVYPIRVTLKSDLGEEMCLWLWLNGCWSQHPPRNMSTKKLNCTICIINVYGEMFGFSKIMAQPMR